MCENQIYAIYNFYANVMFVIFQALLDEKRWSDLVTEFRHENFKLYQLNNHSMFTVTLQAGLSALKTPYPFYKMVINDSPPILRGDRWEKRQRMRGWEMGLFESGT